MGWKIVKNPKNLKSLESLQKSLVRKNVYQSTDPLSIRYDKLKLLLELWQCFRLFLLGPEAFLIPFSNWLPTKKASGAINTLSHFSLIKGRSSSWIFEFFTSYNQQPSVPSFCLQDTRHPSIQFWRCALEEDIQAEDQLNGWEDIKRIVHHHMTVLRHWKSLRTHC